MSKILLPILIAMWSLTAQAVWYGNQYTTNAQGTVTAIPIGTNVMVIDNVNGNDALAAASPYGYPWKTFYDLNSTNVPGYGAATVAKSGDWIFFRPSGVPYQCPELVLNLPGIYATGVNLCIPSGVTVIQSTYHNTNSPGANALPNETANGPFIIPGNESEIVIDGTVFVTNNIGNEGGGLDAVIGWTTGQLVGPALIFGYTNAIATNVFIHGRGYLNGGSDGLIFTCSSAGVTGTNANGFASVDVEDLHIRGNWDTCVIQGTNLRFKTKKLDVYTSSDAPSIGYGDACRVSAMYYEDRYSVWRAAPSTSAVAPDGQNRCVAITGSSLGGITNRFFGSTMIADGKSNCIPFRVPTATNAPYVLTGNWTEIDTNGNSTIVYFAKTIASTASVTSTNFLTVTGSQLGGGSSVNSVYVWDPLSVAYTNHSLGGNHYVTNKNPNIEWDIVSGASPTEKYFSTNGFLGPWWTTNTGTVPTPVTYFSNYMTFTETAQ